MKRVLLILEGDVAKSLLNRLIQANITHTHYDIVYSNDNLISNISKPSNFTFYKFDPTSKSKLSLVVSKNEHDDCLVVWANKFDTIEIVTNIQTIRKNLYITVYNFWELEFEGEYIKNFNAISVLSNSLIQKLPDIPILAQNIGLKKGEVLEVKIPFGSPFAYRYLGSISQNKFKIVALYRNETLLLAKPTLILKPNDSLLLVGEPKVLLQIYHSITQTFGHFPLPFGNNIYLFLDLLNMQQENILNLVKKATQLQLRLNSQELIIKIINPSTNHFLNQIYKITKELKNKVVFDISYEFDLDFKVIKDDIKKFKVGLIVLDKSSLDDDKFRRLVFDLRLPIYKSNSLKEFLQYKDIAVVFNEIYHYEQIIPIVFDVAMQLKFDINAINSDPIGDNDKDNLIDYTKNLSKIFNLPINIISNNQNPIKELFKLNNSIQILPINNSIQNRSIFSNFLTNSDIISYKRNKLDQILIPIVEEENEI